MIQQLYLHRKCVNHRFGVSCGKRKKKQYACKNEFVLRTHKLPTWCGTWCHTEINLWHANVPIKKHFIGLRIRRLCLHDIVFLVYCTRLVPGWWKTRAKNACESFFWCPWRFLCRFIVSKYGGCCNAYRKL